MVTYRAVVSHAARRALWSLNHTNRRDLEDTDYQHLPRRARETEDTELTLGEDEETRVNVTVRALAGVDTDLRSVVNQLDDTQDRLREAHNRIRQLEAQLQERRLHLFQRRSLRFPPCHPRARGFVSATVVTRTVSIRR